MIKLSWTDFKNICTQKSLLIQCESREKVYYLTAYDGQVGYRSSVEKSDPMSVEQIDFETNFLSKTNKKIESKTSTGIIKTSSYEAEGPSATIVSHNFADPCSWYSHSVQVTTPEEMVLESGLIYKFANDRKNIIDLTHGRVYDETNIMIQNASKWALKVYDNGVLKVEDAQYKTAIDQPDSALHRDYYVDYLNGKVTFRSAPVGPVTVTYSYATTSYYSVRPKTGKVLSIKAAEVQFSKDTILRGPFIFEPWFVNHPVYGSMQVPLAFGQQIVYKNAKDFVSACNEGQDLIPAWGELTKDVHVFPFQYARPKPIKFTDYTEIRVYCQNHLPVNAEFATATFYVTIDSE